MEKISREYAEKLAGEFWQDERLANLNIMPNTFEKAMFIEGYMKAVEETNVKGLLEVCKKSLDLFSRLQFPTESELNELKEVFKLEINKLTK